MKATVAGRGNTIFLQHLVHCVSRQSLAAAQRSLEQIFTSRKCVFVEAGLSLKALRATLDDARGQKLEHPTDVRRRHKMQGPSHRPGANDCSIGDSLPDIRFDRV